MSGTIVVSQLGARMHYAVPRILHKAGRLERLYTDICAVKGWPRVLGLTPARLLPSPLRRLRGRVPHDIPRDRICSFGAIGLEATLTRILNNTAANDTRSTLRAGRRLSQAVVRSGFGAACGFYGISGECLEQIRAARSQGLWTAVEQISAPRQVVDRLIAAEVARHPELGEASGRDPFAEEFAAREKAEWALADLIICPSEFVRDGIAAVGGPVERCVVVPYGVDGRFQAAPRDENRDRPLRVLTVGAVGLRKGSPYVFETARRLRGSAEFRLVGPVAVPQDVQGKHGDNVDLVGIVPRDQVVGHYAWADVFLFPAVCEGSSTVVYEALASGLPVITTPNAGSVVRDRMEGFLVPPGDVEGMTSAIGMLIDHRLRAEMAANAVGRAADFTVARYGERLLGAIDTALAMRSGATHRRPENQREARCAASPA